MVNISKGEVSEYHFGSAMNAAGNIILNFGSADTSTRNIYVSDLKLTNSSTGPINVKFSVRGYGTYGKPIELDIPKESVQDFTWELPYRFQVKASTVEERPFIASADGTGVKYAISGYTEKV